MIDFPNSPVNGSTYDYNGVRYTYTTAGTGYWQISTQGSVGIATAAEIDAGTDPVKYVTPSELNLSDYARKTSPSFTGTPLAPTPVVGDDSTKIATTAFVKGQMYATLASPAFTGSPTAPTQSTGDSSTKLATTAYVKNQAYATLASPTFTGNPKSVTPSTGDNDTSIATTAFVKNQAYAPLASPALTGTPTAPTQSTSNNSTRVATTAYVKAQSGQLAPAAHNHSAADVTSGTLAVSRGGTGVATSTGTGSTVRSDSPALTGNPTAPTQTAGNNSTRVATTAYVDGAVFNAPTMLQSGNGWWKDNVTGIIVQWMSKTITSSGTGVTLPTAFTSTSYRVTSGYTGNITDTSRSLTIYSQGTTSFTAKNPGGANTVCHFIAIGW